MQKARGREMVNKRATRRGSRHMAEAIKKSVTSTELQSSLLVLNGLLNGKKKTLAHSKMRTINADSRFLFLPANRIEQLMNRILAARIANIVRLARRPAVFR